MICAIIAAAGGGTRAQLGYNKLLYNIGKNAVLLHTVQQFTDIADSILVVHSVADSVAVKKLLHNENVHFCIGGETRCESIFNALKALPDECSIVIIHDGARPFVSKDVILRCVESCKKYGSGVAGVPVTDTVKCVNTEGIITSTPLRSTLQAAQTPQVFDYKKILAAYNSVDFGACTDDAQVMEKAGFEVRMVMGSYENKKLTTKTDMEQLKKIRFLTGIGYDVHCLTENRKLILGGVEIPYSLGLDGHSDADVLSHAVADALLGAAGLGDIGQHFPDTSDEFLGISSLELLKRVCHLLKSKNCGIINVSAIIIAQKPRLAPFIPQMRENLAGVLNIDPDFVNISATTTEGLGFAGRGEGIASQASVMLETT